MGENKKKERVLHARISDSLDQELKDRASDLGVSVSNLVRNVLLNTFGLVESVVKDGASVARSARGESLPVEPVSSSEPEVLGWQKLILNKNALCTTCNAILPKGTEAAIAVVNRPQHLEPRLTLCTACLKELAHDRPQDDD
jgi:hypothetical protein